MRVGLFHDGAAHQQMAVAALARGFRRHGVEAEIDGGDVSACIRRSDHDLICVWSHRQAETLAWLRQTGRHYLVAERGYFGDRFAFTSLGFDGLNGRAHFPGRAGAGSDRWLRHGLELGRNRGRNLVIAGQVAGDASLMGQNLRPWYERVIASAREQGLSPIFRPHPLSTAEPPHGVPLSFASLRQDLAQAATVITFNSNTGVDAALSGCAVVAMDEGSMAWPVAAHGLDGLADLEPAHAHPDFQAWTHGLAYCQWTADEISSGEAWAHLRSVYEPA